MSSMMSSFGGGGSPGSVGGGVGAPVSSGDIGSATSATGMPTSSFNGATYATAPSTGFQSFFGMPGSTTPGAGAGATPGAGTGSAWQSLAKGVGMISPVAGPIVGGIGSFLQGEQEQSAANQQAKELQEQAQYERFRAGTQIAANDYAAMQKLGSIRAGAGASGVTTTSGSVQQDLMQSTHEAKLTDMYTYYSGQLASQRELYKASMAKYQGSQDMAAGEIGLGTGILTAGMNAASMGAGA